jgi:phage I-like protein
MAKLLAAPLAMLDRQVQKWIGEAVSAVTAIRREQLARIEAETRDLIGAGDRVRNAFIDPDPRVVSIVSDLLLLGYLKGREITQRVYDRQEELTAHADLFEKLPFKQAIDALLNKLAVTRDVFDTLDAVGRSYTFTLARVPNDAWVDTIHQEIVESIDKGETFSDFWTRIKNTAADTGWIGTTERHARLVYEQNIGTAYSAGRMQQGMDLGIKAWRKLPSLADEPRAEHAQWDNQIFKLTPDTPLFPIDYNCNCGWEFVDNIELESLGIDPSTLPVFSPPPSRTGYVPSLAGAYMAMQAPEKRVRDRSPGMKSDLIICELVEIVDPPSRILLSPWGEVKSKAGDFIVDREGVESIRKSMAAHGVMIPIDANHQTLGGDFASPDGTAVARGWIKSVEGVEGEGIYANVEWTAEGAEFVSTKKYRYLSPVFRGDARRRAVELHSVGLTNTPAIADMKPIVNSDPGVPGGDPATAAGEVDSEKENAMDAKEFARQLQAIMQLKNADRPAKIAELAQQALDSGLIDPQMGVLIVAATGVADAASADATPADQAVANSIAIGDLAGAIRNGSLLVNSLRAQVVELKGRLAAAPRNEDIETLKIEQAALKKANADRDFDALIQAHSDRIPPAELANFRSYWEQNRKGAESLLVNTQPKLADAPAAPTAGQRDLIINSARAEYRANPGLQQLASERAAVNDALRQKGLNVLSQDEIGKLVILA